MSSAEGTLEWWSLGERLELVAAPVVDAARRVPSAKVTVIDPALADTAAFCAAYDVAPGRSANCVIVVGRRSGLVRYAALMVLATMRADVNGAVRKALDVRKCSFATMDEATSLTGMEYGGITPIGLPDGWPVYVDEAVVDAGNVVIGTGLRKSKLLVPANELLNLPGAQRRLLAS